MGKLETFDNRQTTWSGLWWHPEYGSYSSAAVSLAELKKFKGSVRLYVRKNKFYNSGENGRPNYCFCFRDSAVEDPEDLEVSFRPAKNEDGNYCDEEGDRLFTREEVMTVIRGTVRDAQSGYTDLLPEDYV